MALTDRPLLFLDCQTTGMRPPHGELLEIAWKQGSAEESFVLRLSEGREIPRRVQEITGLGANDLEQALDPQKAFEKLSQFIGMNPILLIHYAQFEKPFLADLFARFGDHKEIPFQIVCTHQLTKLLFPALPSRNLRATAGFFGPPVLGPNRAAVFVAATEQIWRGLKTELEAREIFDWEGVTRFLTSTKSARAPRYEYRIDKMKRLDLPDRPGVYRMLAKNGEVLYVGKATSLKDRVNSYFRGKKGRDPRKLEMLAQVWDLKVTPTPSPLEAALLETDEIKKFDPPYNVVMKTGRRQIVFYSEDFSSVSSQQSPQHPAGPFKNMNWIEPLRLLSASLATGEFTQIFFNPIEPELMSKGFALFCAAHGLEIETIRTPRSLLAYGLHLYRHYEELEDEETDDESNDSEEAELTAEDVAGKFERLLRRAGAQYWRARALTKLLNARITYEFSGEENELLFYKGQPIDKRSQDPAASAEVCAWRGLDVSTYDRMSVLFSELQKYAHKIDRL